MPNARRTWIVVGLVALCGLVAAAPNSCQETNRLVDSGVANAKIVVPRYPGDGAPCTALDRDYVVACEAARELQEQVSRMAASGAVLPIEATDDPSPADYEIEIHLADTGCRDDVIADLPLDQLTDEESFYIEFFETSASAHCTAGPKLFIGGKRFADIAFYRNHGWATRYGVGEFLDRELGVRWYFPGPLGRVAPSGLTHVEFSGDSVVSNPDYIDREISGLNAVDIEWAERNRVHQDSRIRWPFYHNLNILLSAQVGDASAYYPDTWVYPIDGDGQPDAAATPYVKAAGASPQSAYWQPRLDPDVYDTYEQVARRAAWYTQNNAFEAVSVGLMDDREFHAPVDLPKHYYQYTAAERDRFGIAYDGINPTIWRFLSRVTERWLELDDNADQYICTMAYTDATSPPPASVDLPGNLVVHVGGDRTTTWLDESAGGSMEFDQDYMISWAERLPAGGAMAVGEKYWGGELFVPRYAPEVIRESLRWSYQELPGLAGKPVGFVRGFRAETWPNWPFDGLKLWVAAKVLWDTDFGLTGDPLAEAIDDLFGTASVPMTTYFDLLEAAWTGFPDEQPERWEQDTTRGQLFDVGDHFEWNYYPANILNNRDDPGLLRLYRSRVDAMLAALDSAAAIFDGTADKSTAYYRVLLFKRGAEFLAAMVRFEEAAEESIDAGNPTTEAQALAQYARFVALDDLWAGAWTAYETMIDPPADQLPAGVADDEVGLPRWGDPYYGNHWKKYLPTYDLKDRANSTRAWLAANGHPTEAAALETVIAHLWDWQTDPPVVASSARIE